MSSHIVKADGQLTVPELDFFQLDIGRWLRFHLDQSETLAAFPPSVAHEIPVMIFAALNLDFERSKGHLV